MSEKKDQKCRLYVKASDLNICSQHKNKKLLSLIDVADLTFSPGIWGLSTE